MNVRFALIGLTGVIALSVATGVWLWKQDDDDTTSASKAALPARPFAQTGRFAQSAQTGSSDPQPVSRAAQAAAVDPGDPGPAPAPPEETDTEPPDLTHIDVPAAVLFKATPGQAGRVATLVNLSGQQLDISVITQSESTGPSSAQVTLGPHHARASRDAGLTVHPGDQITVRSPPYRDRVWP